MVDGYSLSLEINTLFALLSFQTEQFGPGADDGIVGSMTAEALVIDWLSTGQITLNKN